MELAETADKNAREIKCGYRVSRLNRLVLLRSHAMMTGEEMIRIVLCFNLK